MNIQFNMLCTTMMDGILGEVDSRYVVAVHHNSLGNLEVQLTKKLSKPTTFSNNVRNSTVLRFRARARDGGLSLGRPRDERITKVDTIARGRPSCVRTANPIRIIVADEL
jgi:hypothetical protein